MLIFMIVSIVSCIIVLIMMVITTSKVYQSNSMILSFFGYLSPSLLDEYVTNSWDYLEHYIEDRKFNSYDDVAEEEKEKSKF